MNVLKGNIDKLTISGSLTLIGINVNKEDYPYSVLAGRLDTQLFNI